MPEKKPKPKSKSTKPNEDEKALWRAATADVVELQQKNAPLHKPRHQTKEAKVHKEAEQRGTISLEIYGSPSVKPSAARREKSSFQIDGNLKKKFESGDLPLDGKIDLHGMTLEQAHRAFRKFMADKIRSGARFLLVVTGKGVGGEGVIRKNLPLWCEDGDLHPHILRTAPANAKHGGGGATYILLRKPK